MHTYDGQYIRAKPGIHPLEKKDTREVKWPYEVSSMRRNRLPAGSGKGCKGESSQRRVGIRWDGVVNKIWKNL